eukprot:61137-Rhodomonas_salina.1
MGVQPAARVLCSGSAPPALAFCPCGLCLPKNRDAAGLRAAVMSVTVEMLQVHVDVKLAASDGRGTSRKDTLMRICVGVWRLCGDHSCVGSG